MSRTPMRILDLPTPLLDICYSIQLRLLGIARRCARRRNAVKAHLSSKDSSALA
jgi:hypothetical protein